MREDDLVGSVAQRNLIQVVGIHEPVEDVGTQHHGLRNGDGSVVESVELRVALDDVVEEGQATALASKRPFADPGEVGVLVVLPPVEDGHHTHILHLAVFHDGFEDDLPVCIHILEFVPCDMLEELRDGEDGPCTQPAAHMVA